MIRRRRRPREIPFSFDSFLDVVANVCGIIIRLILVVWVGARSYTSLQDLTLGPEETNGQATASAEAEPPESADPVQNELVQQRRQLAEAETVLLEQLRQVHQIQTVQEQTQHDLTAVSTRRLALVGQRASLEHGTAEQKKAAQGAVLSLEEVRQRSRRLQEQIQALQKLPPVRQSLRYRTPVSRPLDAEEMMFECCRGRVTFVDVAALLEEVKRSLRDKAETLRTSWEVKDLAGPVGPFQLRYKVEARTQRPGNGSGGRPSRHARELSLRPGRVVRRAGRRGARRGAGGGVEAGLGVSPDCGWS